MTALRDFLWEFEGNYIFNDEFDLFRHADGVLALEGVLTNENPFWADAAIKRFRMFVDYLYRKRAGRNWKSTISPEIKEITEEFLEQIVYCEKQTSSTYFNPHIMYTLNTMLHQLIHSRRIFYPIRKFNTLLKDISFISSKTSVLFTNTFETEQYIAIAKNYLEKLMCLFSDCDVVTLMHPLIISGDINHQLRYFDDYKMLVSHRDPRDVYVDVAKKKIEYIPWEDITLFVNWYKKFHVNNPIEHEHVMNINFEDLVLKYDETTENLKNFIGFETCNQRKFSRLNPDISSKNVGLYRDFADQKRISYLERELEVFCYNG